ncbi:19160_t:CDS:1, partial [Racocetra persica]
TFKEAPNHRRRKTESNDQNPNVHTLEEMVHQLQRENADKDKTIAYILAIIQSN